MTPGLRLQCAPPTKKNRASRQPIAIGPNDAHARRDPSRNSSQRPLPQRSPCGGVLGRGWGSEPNLLGKRGGVHVRSTTTVTPSPPSPVKGAGEESCAAVIQHSRRRPKDRACNSAPRA